MIAILPTHSCVRVPGGIDTLSNANAGTVFCANPGLNAHRWLRRNHFRAVARGRGSVPGHLLRVASFQERRFQIADGSAPGWTVEDYVAVAWDRRSAESSNGRWATRPDP